MQLQNTRTTPPLNSRSRTSRRRGFSLIELLIVIVIVVILGLILLTVFAKTLKLVRSWRSDAGHASSICVI